MLSLVSSGQVELRDEAQFVDMAILPCKLHIADGWFITPAAIKPAFARRAVPVG